MRYGFKVHTLELARGRRGRIRLPIATCFADREVEKVKKAREVAEAAGDPPPAPLATGDYRDLLLDALRELRDSETALTDVPKLMAVTDGANEFVPEMKPGTVRLRVVEVTADARRVSATVEYGHLGYAHRALAERREDDAQLDNKSPVQFFRVEFLLPEQGETGLIAAETISGGSALPVLVSWINHTMRGKYGDDAMVRLMAPQMTDTARVDALLKRDAVAEIHLVKHGAEIDGMPSDGKITVVEQVRTTSKMQNAKTLVDSWVARLRSKDGMTEDQRKGEIRALAGVVSDVFAEVEFDDGVVKLDPGTGRMVEVRPSRIGELFIYEISDLWPDQDEWLGRTREQILALAGAEGLSVVWG
jgi:hypothetical protein